jgi:hypothetical protein
MAWLTATIFAFFASARSRGDRVETLTLSRSGALATAQSKKLDTSSSPPLPPSLPTWSMSGSLKPPGPANSAHLSFRSILM